MKKPNNNIFYLFGLLGQIGFVIAIPVAALAYLGAMADKKFSTSPLFILLGIFLSMIISGLSICKMIKKIEGK